MKETNILEFKEEISKSFLKTVSAFSNYNGGTILFGIDDDGKIKGIDDYYYAKRAATSAPLQKQKGVEA